ncbi:MAG: hypothetical protein ACOX2Q_07845 [Dehalobacterium sp.]
MAIGIATMPNVITDLRDAMMKIPPVLLTTFYFSSKNSEYT